MRKLGLTRLLQLVVLVPLLAMVVFGGVLVTETVQAYREVERLAALEQLVAAASRLTIKALNAESGPTQACHFRIGGPACPDGGGPQSFR